MADSASSPIMDHYVNYFLAELFARLEASNKTAFHWKPAQQDFVLEMPEQESDVTSSSDTEEPEILEGREPEPISQLPVGWEARRDELGRLYFLDHITCSATWYCPICSADLIARSRERGDTEQTPLPEGWAQAIEPVSKRPYYIDHRTKTTSWVRPVAGIEATTRPLPKGWERRRTEDGRNLLYFVNHNNKSTTWVLPERAAEGDGASQDAHRTTASATRISSS